jgi:hypothetical protein
MQYKGIESSRVLQQKRNSEQHKVFRKEESERIYKKNINEGINFFQRLSMFPFCHDFPIVPYSINS